jgi:hypothetical protein
MDIASLARKLARALPTVTVIAVVTIATGFSAGCSASASTGIDNTNGTYHGHGVSFKVPDGWGRLTGLTTQTNTGNEIWSEAFAPESGSNLVGIAAYATTLAITKKNADKAAPGVAAAIKNLFTSDGGSVLSGPTRAVIGDLAGYRFETTYIGKNGETFASDLFMVWNGHTEYYFNCQHKAHDSHRAAIERGCKTITGSFKVA